MIWVIGILAMLAVGFGGGWQVNDWIAESKIADIKREYENERKEAEAEAQKEKARADEIANRFETRLAKLRIVHTTVNQEVRRETEKLVYGNPDCDLPASGVLLVNRSVDEANRAAGYVSSQVPSAAPAPAGPGVDGRTAQP